MSDEILKQLIAEVVELRHRVAALETRDWVIQDGRFSRSLAVGKTSPATGYALDVAGFINTAQTVNQATYPSINASQTAQTLQDGPYTGTDYTMTTMYVAVKFVASGAHTMGDFTIRIKESADITNRTDSLTGYLYSDDGGSPSKPLAVLATGRGIRFGSLTTSYQTLSLGTQYTLASGTTYWLVLKWSTTPVGGNIVLDSDVSANAGATSTDGSVWTNTNVRLRYTIRGRTHYGIVSSSTNSIGVYGFSNNAYGVYGFSANDSGVHGASTNSIGVHGSSSSAMGVYGYSANNAGVYGSSPNSSGVRGDSINSYAGYFVRNTAAPSSAVPVFFILQDHASDPNAALRVRQDGTGNILELQNSTTTVVRATPGGDFWIANDCSALSFTDRTPWFEGDALAEIQRIKGKDRKIDYATLPEFCKRQIPGPDEASNEGRDLGAMVTLLTVAVQQLAAKVEALEKKKE